MTPKSAYFAGLFVLVFGHLVHVTPAVAQIRFDVPNSLPVEVVYQDDLGSPVDMASVPPSKRAVKAVDFAESKFYRDFDFVRLIQTRATSYIGQDEHGRETVMPGDSTSDYILLGVRDQRIFLYAERYRPERLWLINDREGISITNFQSALSQALRPPKSNYMKKNFWTVVRDIIIAAGLGAGGGAAGGGLLALVTEALSSFSARGPAFSPEEIMIASAGAFAAAFTVLPVNYHLRTANKPQRVNNDTGEEVAEAIRLYLESVNDRHLRKISITKQPESVSLSHLSRVVVRKLESNFVCSNVFN